MGQELGEAIALCTTWAEGDIETWGRLAADALDKDPAQVLGQVTHVAVQLARAVASQAGWDVSQVFQHIALDAEEDGQEPPSA